MTFLEYNWRDPEYSKTLIEPPTDIANYDIIRTPDSNMFHRPLETPLNGEPIVSYELETPRRREETLMSRKRPEPEKLDSGQLKVMVSPGYFEDLATGSQGGEHWRQYVKSRTPATYQQIRCDEAEWILSWINFPVAQFQAILRCLFYTSLK